MNLAELRNETLMLIDEKPQPSTIKILNSGINYAYNKISNEKLGVSNNTLNKDTDIVNLPTEIDQKIICFFAAFYFFKVDGDEEGKGSTWLNLFTDGFENIKDIRFKDKIVNVYNMGGDYD